MINRVHNILVSTISLSRREENRMENPAPDIVIGRDLMKRAKTDKETKKILRAIKKNYSTTSSSKTFLSDGEKTQLRKLKRARQEMIDNLGELSQEERDEIIQNQIEDQTSQARRRMMTSNKAQSDNSWKELSEDEQQRIDREIDDENQGKELTEQERAWKRAYKRHPLTQRQIDLAEREGTERGKIEGRERVRDKQTIRGKKREELEALSTKDLVSGAIALNQDSTLVTNNELLARIVKEQGGKTQDFSKMVSQLKEEDLLPKGKLNDYMEDMSQARIEIETRIARVNEKQREQHKDERIKLKKNVQPKVENELDPNDLEKNQLYQKQRKQNRGSMDLD
jgi:hypothetical protein